MRYRQNVVQGALSILLSELMSASMGATVKAASGMGLSNEMLVFMRNLMSEKKGQTPILLGRMRVSPLAQNTRQSGSDGAQKSPPEAGLFRSASGSITWLAKPCNQRQP